MNTTSKESPPKILTVDDNPQLLDLYAIWLGGDYEVRRASSGEDAIGSLDESIHVVLVDRQMPSVSGVEVADEISRQNLDCRVGMISGVEPGGDIMGMEIDVYLTKPVGRDTVVRAVEDLVNRGGYDGGLRELCSLRSKRRALRASRNTIAQETARELDVRIDELEYLHLGRRSESGESMESITTAESITVDRRSGPA